MTTATEAKVLMPDVEMPRVDSSQWTRKDRATHRRAQGQLLSALGKYITLGYPDAQIVAIATNMVAFHHRLRRWSEENSQP